MNRYPDTSAVVIGGTSGIGLATARLLRDEGARVTATGSSDGSVTAARAVLGPGVEVVRSDLTRPDHVEELAVGLRGPIDLLVANAGATANVPFDQVDEELYDRLFAVNTRATFFLVQRLAPLMAEGGGIVVTTSVANVKGLSGSSIYAATKAATRSMVRSLARELQPRGVRVNAVSPGPTDTGILERSLPAAEAAAARGWMRANNPMSRFGRPEEVAAAVLFLGLDATFTTGAELPVDGGVSQL